MTSRDHLLQDRTDVAGVEDAAPKFQKRERDTWNTRFDFLLALIGFSVGLGNVWRFPYLCYKHGGGAFLIPYLICVGIGGVPLLFLEIAIGQFMQKGGIRVWSIMPILEGIGYATTIIVFLLDCYYNVILAWTFYYLFASLTSELPWATCGHEWNTDQCSLLANVTANDTGLVDPATEYWERKVLGIHLSTGVDDVGAIKWDLCLCLLLAWIVVYMCIWKGIKTSGKVMYFTATSPYIFMFILLVRGCTLPGAINGIKFYVVPDWKLMLNTEVWVAAGTQIFFSYSISLGTLTALGSYNKYKHNSYRDAYWFALVNSGTSILSGFVIFSILGYMAQKLNVDVKDVVKGGPGLAFIAYPQAVAVMPLAPFWSFLFFFMIILLGLDSQFVGVEGLVTAISDIYTQDLKKGYRKQLFVLGICSVAFLIGLSMVTHGGMYVFQMFDHYSGSRVILLLAFFQLTGISWLYGVQKFYADLKSMLGFSINPYMGFSWLITAPTFCLVMFGFVLSRYKELTYDTYEYPTEAISIAWFIALISISMIPIFAVWNLVIAYKKEGSLWRAIQFTITPQIPPRGLTDDEMAQERGYGNADVIMGKSGFPDTSSGGAMEQLPTYEDVAGLNKRRDNSNAIIQSTKL